MYVIGITGPSGAGKTTALRVLEELGGRVFDCDAVYHEMLERDGELLGRIEAAFPGSVRDYALDRKALGSRVFADPAGLQRLTDITQPLVAKRVLEEIAKSDAAASDGRPMAAPTNGVVPDGGRPMAAPTSETSLACHSERSDTRRACLVQEFVSPSPVPCSRFPVPSTEATSSSAATFPARGRYFAVIDAIGLFESGLGARCDLTVAVLADPEVRVRRLMARDSITEEYARSRIAAQKPMEWYASRADLVLENNGTEAEFAENCRAAFVKRLT